ncbi:glycosyltransferase, partial [uncultured Amnibacterium sp.]|uniref:glycosyltransferase n=1 Tax=uncultured Amnibacterium sp. TaxID=1631851 RepID=UPI0035CC4967
VRPRRTPKLVYVHSPARYIWNPELDDRGSGVVARVASLILKPIDRFRAHEATSIAANSDYVRERIKKAWGRDAQVIHPPVDVERIQAVDDWAAVLQQDERTVLDGLPEQFLLGASRFIGYKRLDLVIRAGEASGLPVVLAGGGPERDALLAEAASATVPVHIVDEPEDALLYALYQRASVFVFPAVEDFGMMPVEAMACGTPVIGNALGGVRESVVPGLSGCLLEEFDASSLRRAVQEAGRLDRAIIRSYATSFSVSAFQVRVRAWLDAALDREVVPCS